MMTSDVAYFKAALE